MMELFGVERRMLCDLVDPGDIAGRLTAEAAQRLGLSQGLPVVSAGGDQQCAALGLGLTGPGKMVANTGTGSYLIAASMEPRADPGMGIGCNVAAVPGTFILEAGVVTSGSIYQWFRREFYRDPVPDAEKYKKIDEEASASPAGAKGVLLLPHFKGRGSPAWNPAARGAFLNLTPEAGRGDMARAVLEGIALEIGENIETLEQLSMPAAAIEVSGGMTKSSLFNQIQADCYGRVVERQDDAEATALGAWTSAAVRLGFYPSFDAAIRTACKDTARESFRPDAERNAVYRKAAEERKRLYAGMTQGR
jgi:sugar (pentulose or hexulose) kinase